MKCLNIHQAFVLVCLLFVGLCFPAGCDCGRRQAVEKPDLSKDATVVDVSRDSSGTDGNGDSAPEDAGAKKLSFWPGETPKAPENQWLSSLPWRSDVSVWFGAGCGDGQPKRAHQMGDFGIGNGRSFALLGYSCPIHALHSMTGPTYQRDGGFFPDTWTTLRVSGASKDWAPTSGHVYRFRGTAIVMTEERNEQLSLQSVTFAPKGSIAANAWLKQSILRVFIVRNRSQKTLGAMELGFVDAVAKRGTRRRLLFQLAPTFKPLASGDSLAISSLKAGEEAVVVLAYAMFEGDAIPAAFRDALKAAKPRELLTQTHAAWQSDVARAAVMKTPDARVNQAYTGMLVTLATQRAEGGGVSPMSRYTRFWTRDSIGPMRLWTRVGLHDDAKQLLSYYHHVAATAGTLQNSYGVNLKLTPPPKEPDWAKLPALSGRTAAEAPSYLPLMYQLYRKASGDDAMLRAHYPMLRHAMLGQPIPNSGLLPFSGDETYRTALAMTLGLSLTHSFEECCDSANSSFLFVAGALALADAASLLEKDEDAKLLRQRAERVRKATEAAFWRKESIYLPFLDRKGGLQSPAYPEVSTKPLWLGYHKGKDEQALAHVKAMVAAIGQHPDGFWQLPIHERYQNYLGLGLDQGIYTGMAPGYILSNLTHTEHPNAALMFNALARVFSMSGNVAEYQLYGDHNAFQVIYDKTGTREGDLTARYRPWEGGIVIDAMLEFLLGFIPDAPRHTVTLVPRLVNGWPEVSWKRLRVGASSISVVISQDGDRRRVVVELTKGTKPLRVKLAVPVGAADVKSVSINGKTSKEYETWSPFGHVRVGLPVQTLSPGSPLNVVVQYQAR